jgi:hypothetical protein
MLFSSAAQAMEIRQFDKMVDSDQDEYVAELALGAQKVLKMRAEWILRSGCINFYDG